MASSCDCQGAWFLFIDFIVRNISEEEALSFPNTWKLDYCSLPEQLNQSILSLDASISVLIYSPHGRFTLFVFVHRNRDDNLVQHECLRFEELHKPGKLVTILIPCETEYRSDGTHRAIRPARPSLARVASRLLTTTSIRASVMGDLYLHLSRYTLTPLKLVCTAEW
ncbi:hypothetical protein DFH29DRAFT_961896 [Suillus ampliporus]|nr:hypothetical protein DFH29DRAFT_961896 [Suillus ampliporus]